MANEEVIFKLKMSTAEAEKGLDKVKKNIKDTNAELKNSIDSFGVFGVTIGDVKGKFADLRKIGGQALSLIGNTAKKAALGMRLMFGGKMATGAKALFNVIKLGIASTGIGVLVVAFGSLITFLTQTKKGAELLQVGFKAVGAAIAVITDRISKVGGAIVKVFKGDVKGAFNDVKDAVSGVGEEIVKETQQMVGLTKASQKLRDSQRELNVETARRRAEVQELKFIAEDLTKDEATRLEAAQKAFAIEKELTDQRVANAEKALALKKAEVDASESSAEDLDELAQMEIDLFNIREEAVGKQIELNNKVNTIRKEAADKRKAAEDEAAAIREEQEAHELEVIKNRYAVEEELALLKAESDEERELLALEQRINRQIAETEDAETKRLLHESLEMQKAAITKKFRDAEKANDDANRDAEIANAKAVADAKMAGLQTGLSNAIAVFGADSKAGKAAAVAQATINTFQGASKAIAQFGVPLGIPFAALAVAAGLKQVAEITKTPEPEVVNVNLKKPKMARGGLVRGAGTGTSDSISARLSSGETVINARSTRMFKPVLSAINEAGGGIGFAGGGTLDTGSGGLTLGAVKAFVVTDDITDSQKGLEKIRQKAKI